MTTRAVKVPGRRRVHGLSDDEPAQAARPHNAPPLDASSVPDDELDSLMVALADPRKMRTEIESMFVQIDRNLDRADRHLAGA